MSRRLHRRPVVEFGQGINISTAASEGSRQCVPVLTEYSENSLFTRNFDLDSSSDRHLEWLLVTRDAEHGFLQF